MDAGREAEDMVVSGPEVREGGQPRIRSEVRSRMRP
jgi:hypothetical protein